MAININRYAELLSMCYMANAHTLMGDERTANKFIRKAERYLRKHGMVLGYKHI